MCFVKALFWDDEETVMQLHPPKSEWINNHEYCLHLWRPLNQPIPRPPGIAVGVRSAVAVALALFCIAFSASAYGQQAGVTTRAYDNARTGMNTHETVLTQASVAAKGLVLETTIPVIGDARGMEAQPLIGGILTLTPGRMCAALPCINATRRYVMVLPSMANVVRGVDAETGEGYWQGTLGVPVQGSAKIDFHSINDKWGCLSTGVIDPDAQRWYGVCWVSVDGSGTPASGRYRMFGLNLADGSQAFAPVDVQGADTSMWKQRSSLVMTSLPDGSGLRGRKTIFFAHGSVYEIAAGYTGGITAFDVASATVAAQMPMTSGVWMAGQGLVADESGDLYAITANGDFDPSKGWYGESFVKVRYTPAAGGAPPHPAVLQVVDQLSPLTDFQRAGEAVAAASVPKMAGMSAASEGMKAAAAPVGGGMDMPLAKATVQGAMNAQGQPVTRVYPVMASGAWSDEDWGSAGPACLFALKVCVAAGKDGIGYPIRTDALGGTTRATAGTRANYAKLAAPCVWLTMSPGPIACDPADPRTLNFFPNGVTAHLHMTPVQLWDPVLGAWTIFAWGENAQLHKWRVSAGGALTYVAQSHEYASADVRGNPPGGMPGGFCTGSSSSSAAGAGNDAGSALLFCSIPYGDANATVTNGRLLVYDPIHLAADGSLRVLWDSQRWGVAYTFNKFLPPTVWNGRVYLPNYSGGVMVLGLGR
ncbi:MAG: hypothetical protein M3O02_11090 [Acidobacteriota bacterium]|nr:hypothetical protein [Acidobacteriota bacterium]